jgi:drug/metabolite transporter (DMT)-like permease
MPHDPRRQRGILLAVSSAALSSTAALFQARACKVIPPLIVSMAGAAIGGVLLALLRTARRERLSLPARSQLRPLLMLVLLRQVIGGALFSVGISLTIGIKAIFFTKAEPYFVLFWHWLLDGEAIDRKHLSLLVLHFIGALVLSTGGTFSFGSTQLGDLLLLVAILFSSLSYRFGARLSHEAGPMLTNTWALIGGALLLAPLAFSISPLTPAALGGKAWEYVLFYVLLYNVIGLTFWYSALKDLPAWLVSALRALGPLFAAPLAWAIFGESLTAGQMIGGAVVIGTAVFISAEPRNARAQ